MSMVIEADVIGGSVIWTYNKGQRLVGNSSTIIVRRRDR